MPQPESQFERLPEPTPWQESTLAEAPTPAQLAPSVPAPVAAPVSTRCNWDDEKPWVPQHLRFDRDWTADEVRQIRSARKRFIRNKASASQASSGWDSASSTTSAVQRRPPAREAADLSMVVEEPAVEPLATDEHEVRGETSEAPEPKVETVQHPAPVGRPEGSESELSQTTAPAQTRTPVEDWEQKPWVPVELRTAREWTADEKRRVKNLRNKWLKKTRDARHTTDSDASLGSVHSRPATPKTAGSLLEQTLAMRAAPPSDATPKPALDQAAKKGWLPEQTLAMRAQSDATPKPALAAKGSLLEQTLVMRAQTAPHPSPEVTPKPAFQRAAESPETARATPTPSRLGPTPGRVQNLRSMWEQTPPAPDARPVQRKPLMLERLQAFTPPKPPSPPPPQPPSPPKPRVRRGYEAPTKASENSQAPRSDARPASRAGSRPSSAASERHPSRPTSAASRTSNGRVVRQGAETSSAPSARGTRPTGDAQGEGRAATSGRRRSEGGGYLSEG
jgi:hypothetical protein